MEEFEYDTPKLVFVSENEFVEETSEPIETFFEGNRLEDFRTYQEERLAFEEEVWYMSEHNEAEEEHGLRKSMSLTQLPIMRDEVDKVERQMKQMRVTESKVKSSISKDHLDQLAQPKRYRSVENIHSQGQYMTMAESVQRFHKATPQRFRSKPTKESFHSKHNNPMQRTIPQSPMLATKSRYRPPTVLSAVQLEEKQVEEMKKFKIKAQPLNKKILEAPIIPQAPVPKKPSTVVKPFNITDSKKQSPAKGQHLKNTKRAEPMKALPMKTENKPSRTIPKPFSFEPKTMEIFKKREELINKVKEEEKKMREFHARPPPKSIYKSPKCKLTRGTGSLTSVRSDDTTAAPKFKAKPPTVLYKKPFEPQKAPKPTVEVAEFHLNTDKRAKERQEFEEMKREREQQYLLKKKLMEERERELEEQQRQELRKQTVYKAQPVPNYKKFEVHPSSKPLTDAQSPKLHYRHSSNNKENMQDNSL